MEIVSELEEVSFSMDQSEKEAGDEIIGLLQKNGKPNNTNSTDSAELEIFHQAALKLGITSSRAVLTERRSLKKLIERARSEGDKKKESVLSYLCHLVRKYSKLFRSEFGDDTDSQGSAPCSPTVLGFEDSYGSCGGMSRAFDRNLSKIRSFNFRPSGFRSGNLPIPPEELRCPISLQLMYDPVIISSGQTYERVCIEKWLNDGHKTCPKTQQELVHLCLTPNYCVKGLIASWCEHNGFPIPESPPDNFDMNWSVESGDSNNRKSMEVVPMEEESCITQVAENSDYGSPSPSSSHALDGNNEGYNRILALLEDGKSTGKTYKLVEQIRYVLKDDAEARTQMGANGFAEALVRFLRLAVYDGDGKAQEMGAMALFNLTVSNNRYTFFLSVVYYFSVLAKNAFLCKLNQPRTEKKII